ncbi:biotin--[acetyl-CoA-carboxylase] ligase [bacterium]|nr:biotin--[acetyl-CoA-carboxylase] ligase [bacterium]
MYTGMQPDTIDPSRLIAVLKPLCGGVRLIHVEETESTNRTLMDMAKAGAGHLTTLVADRQTHGRGRHRRNWASPVGGLYMSVLLKLSRDNPPVTLIPLAVGLALRKAITDEARQRGGDLEVTLKWPNDLITENGKLAGILCETIDTDDEWLIVAGIGVNIRPLSAETRRLVAADVTSLLEESDVDWTRSGLIVAFLRHLTEVIKDWEDTPEQLRREWTAASNMMDHLVTVKTGKGTIEGKAIELTEQGALRLRTEHGPVEINSAEGIEVHE